MPHTISVLRDRILEAALPQIEEEGVWTWSAVEAAAQRCSVQQGLEKSIFPHHLVDVVAHFSDYTDRKMLKKLEKLPTDSLRVRDKVRHAVLTRYAVIEPHKAAVKAASAFWAVPTHAMQGQRVLWRTADKIWTWAGDTATDYNRQSKRLILSSLLATTTMVWLGDETEGGIVTQAFLDRRLENIMEFGRIAGTMKKVVPNLFRRANESK